MAGLVPAMHFFFKTSPPSSAAAALHRRQRLDVFGHRRAWSSADNCAVLRIMRTIDPPALSPSGVCPVSRKKAMSLKTNSLSEA
jgi:hypothetical protein